MTLVPRSVTMRSGATVIVRTAPVALDEQEDSIPTSKTTAS
jgi:hypothetical protein